MVILIVIGALGTIPKGLVHGLENLKIRGQVETISVIKIDQNTEKFLEDFKKLAVTQTSVRNHQLTLV